MQAHTIEQTVQEAMQVAHCQATVDGSHVDLLVVSDEFNGLTPLKRQQRIYGLFNNAIKSGDIHALNMKLYTLDQWQAL